MSAINHKVKIILHLRIGHYNWIEDMQVKPKIKMEKEVLQKALKPGQVPGGSSAENIGVAYGYPDAKVFNPILYGLKACSSEIFLKDHQKKS